jgi:hypothetical protein
MNARHVKLLSGKRKVGSGDGSILGNAEPEAGDEKNAPFELTEEDEALIKSIQFGKKQAPRQQHAANMSELKRLDEDDEWQMEERRKRDVAAMEERQDKAAASQQSSTTSTNMPTLIVKKQRRLDAIDNGTTKTTQSAVPLLSIPTMTVAASSSRSIDVNGGSRAHDAKLGGLADLLGGYSSDNGNTNMAEPAVSTSVPTKMAVAASSSSSSIKVDDGSRADAKLGGLADLLGGYSSDDSD